MKRSVAPLVWGTVLVIVGVLALVQTLGLVERLMPSMWALAFGAGGLAFLALFLLHREQWWAVIPGMALLGIGLLIAGSELIPELGDRWGGPVFLALLSLAFWLVHAVRRDAWWAIIPGGVLATLALAAYLDSGPSSSDHGWVLFLGMAATFALVALAPGGRQRRWALIPAASTLALGLMILAQEGELAGYVIPGAMLVCGAVLVFRGFLRQPQE